MLKRTAQFIFLIVMSLAWQSAANAQTSLPPSPLAEFTYPQKTEAINLARAGDAEAMYKLGLSYLYGVNASQNPKVAERFFLYAAEKGHNDAGTYLIRTRKINGPSQTIKSPDVTVRKPQAKTAAGKRARAERKQAALAKQKARAEQRKAQAEIRRAAAQEKRALAKQKRQAAQRKKALADKKRARAKAKALAEETVSVTPTAANAAAPALQSTAGLDETINPYIRDQSLNNLKLTNIPKGRFLIIFLILFLSVYLFASYFIKSGNPPDSETA